MQANKIIFCDIDSTLHSYDLILGRVIKDLYGVTIPNENKLEKWKLEEIPGIGLSPDQVAEAISISDSEEYIKDMTPYDDAAEVINTYKAAGCTLYFITARNNSVYYPMLNWLINNNFIHRYQKGAPPGQSELFCFNKNPEQSIGNQKIEFASIIAMGEISILIDDNPEVLKLASYTSNILPATILHPWNRAVVKEYGIPCAKNWVKLSQALTKSYGLPPYDKV